MERRGRKPKVLPISEVDNLIYRFTQEEKVTGLIKYKDVFLFSKKLFETNDIKYQLSEDYWRREGRQGRERIDKANKLYESTLVSGKESISNTVVNTEEIIAKLCTCRPLTQRKLIKQLKINENKAKELGKLEKNISDLKQELNTQKNKNKDLKELIDQYETIMFSWFSASIKSDVPLINLMTVGKSKHPIIELFFETVFSNPVEGYEKFEEYRMKSREAQPELTHHNSMVTPLRKSRIQQITENYNKK